MQSILEEFARGNISPEPRYFERNSHYGRTMKSLADYETKLFEIIGEAEKEILKKFIDTQAEISLLSGIDRFIYGYRLRVLMTTEVFNGKDALMSRRLSPMTSKSIISDLYHGNINAWERRPTRTAENMAVNRKIEDEKRYFLQKMSLDDMQRFEALENLYAQSNDFGQESAFSCGFKLGTLFMCAVFMDENEPILDK